MALEELLILCLFTIIELFIMYKYYRNKDNGKLWENVLLSAVILAFLVCNNRLKYPSQKGVTAILVISVIGHTLVGEYFDVYHRNKYYDRFLHCVGSFSFALFAYQITENVIGPIQAPKLYIQVLIITFGISLGVIFELLEFAIDSALKKPKYSKNQHGLTDTNYDLLGNLIGAIAAGIISMRIFD